MAWLFGYDLFRAYLPERVYVGKDRSYRSMKFYTEKLNASALSYNTSLYDVHTKLFRESEDQYYPNIIINCTSTKNQYGVVSAVSKKTTFPGAINLLDIKQEGNPKTLNYFEALSTCNRFPLISPAANVPTKGHFLDGGYFENSGILSLYSFKKEIERHEGLMAKQDTSFNTSIFKNNTKLVSVRNDKYNYLQSLIASVDQTELEIHNDGITKNENLTEIGAIIGGIGSLERLPFYIKDLMSEYDAESFDFINIDLPYYITSEDIENCFQGDIESNTLKKIQDVVDKSNNEIIRLLKESTRGYQYKRWGIIEPPTARILSRPAEIYMKEMMGHYFFESQLKKLGIKIPD